MVRELVWLEKQRDVIGEPFRLLGEGDSYIRGGGLEGGLEKYKKSWFSVP